VYQRMVYVGPRNVNSYRGDAAMLILTSIAAVRYKKTRITT
jgi:hypothetical protein